jgi:Apea-like HEPN
MKRGTSANALRRFSYASDRDRDDDRLVDLMIAAESIFLSDTGAPQERGELRYRLALRAAFFIDAPDSTRIAVFKHMKRAYDVRSAIVHGGGEVGNDLLKSLKETPISLKEFVEVTRKLVRSAIKKRIEMAAAKGNFNIDWDSLIIPSSTH